MKPRRSACANLGWRERLFVIAVCIQLVAVTSSYAIMVTFFPIHATALGVSPYAISMIFTAFSIGNLLTSLIAGQLASRFGRRTVLLCGALLVAAASLFIGFTPELAGDDVSLMVTIFTGTRLILGGGVACVRLSLFAVLGDAFPQSRGLVLGSATSMIALGYMLGPAFGGALFAMSGFRLPFIVLSLLVLVCTAPVLWMWPARRTPADSDAMSDAQGSAALAANDSAAQGDQTGGAASPVAGAGIEVNHKGDQDKARAVCGWQSGDLLSGDGNRPSWRQLVGLLPADVWVVAWITLIYESKWAWWDIYVTQFLFVGEFEFSIQTAALHISLIASIFATGCPLGGLLGDRLGNRRIHLVVGLLGALGVIYTTMGPWQLAALGATARRVLLYVYLVTDGGMSCLIEPQLVPHMLSLAEQRSRADGGRGPNEHLTNFVTSFAQFANNAGGVAGPFIAVPLIENVGFRGALAVWGVLFFLVSALLTGTRLAAKSRPCGWGRRRRAWAAGRGAELHAGNV